MATARFTIYIAPSRGRPGRPFLQDDVIEPDARFGWRMLAANNREVARSATTFADVASCIDAVDNLHHYIGEALAIASRTGRADWSWRLRIDGMDAAASSRTYQRRLQCEAACALFVELVPCADLVEVHPSGHFVPTRRHRLAGPVVNPEYGTQRG
ncbi:MAG TPA: hypothetical protein VGF84_24465 [Micromonosporaceae bacterium]